MEIARLFFAWLAIFLRLPYQLRAWHRPQEKRRDKGTVRFHYKKKLSLSLVLFMLLKFISFSMSFRLTFFVSFQAVSGTVNLLFMSKKDNTP